MSDCTNCGEYCGHSHDFDNKAVVGAEVWDQGRDAGRSEVLPILQELIAELVGDDGDGHEITPDGDTCTVCEAVDKAEARLREVQGE